MEDEEGRSIQEIIVLVDEHSGKRREARIDIHDGLYRPLTVKVPKLLDEGWGQITYHWNGHEHDQGRRVFR